MKPVTVKPRNSEAKKHCFFPGKNMFFPNMEEARKWVTDWKNEHKKGNMWCANAPEFEFFSGIVG